MTRFDDRSNRLPLSPSPVDVQLEKVLNGSMGLPLHDSRILESEARAAEDAYHILDGAIEFDPVDTPTKGLGARFRRQPAKAASTPHVASEADILAAVDAEKGITAIGVVAAAGYANELASQRTTKTRAGLFVASSAERMHAAASNPVRTRLLELLADAYGTSERYPFVAGHLGVFAVGLALHAIGDRDEALPELSLRTSRLYLEEWRAKKRPDIYYPNVLRILAHKLQEAAIEPEHIQGADTVSDPQFGRAVHGKKAAEVTEIVHTVHAKFYADMQRERHQQQAERARTIVLGHADRMGDKRREVATSMRPAREAETAGIDTAPRRRPSPAPRPEATASAPDFSVRLLQNFSQAYAQGDAARMRRSGVPLLELQRAKALTPEVERAFEPLWSSVETSLIRSLLGSAEYIERGDKHHLTPEVASLIQIAVTERAEYDPRLQQGIDQLGNLLARVAFSHYNFRGANTPAFRRIIAAGYVHELLAERGSLPVGERQQQKLQHYRDKQLLDAFDNFVSSHFWTLPNPIKIAINDARRRRMLRPLGL